MRKRILRKNQAASVQMKGYSPIIKDEETRKVPEDEKKDVRNIGKKKVPLLQMKWRKADPKPHSVLDQVPVFRGGGVSIYAVDVPMDQSEIIQALKNPEQEKVSDIPPVKPKGGETYAIHSKNIDDWRCDQYQWINNGSSTVSTEDGYLLHRKYFKIKLPGMKSSRKKRAIGSTSFTRSAYYLESNPELVLVRYAGDESSYSPFPHGNNKTDNREFVRTCPSVIKQMKEDSENGLSPSQIVDKLNAANNVPSGEYIGVLNARDMKQVNNISTNVKSAKKKKKLTKDEIYNLVLLAHHFDGFIQEIKIFPDLVSILGLPEIFDVFNQLLDIEDTNLSMCLGYDTTFNLGDFYVTPLIFRHILFESKPTIPLAFLIHDRKYQKCHERLFDYLAEKIPKIVTKKIAIVTDREKGVSNAIKKCFQML
jgi:hypothetical protein